MEIDLAIAVYNMCGQCKYWTWNANYSPRRKDILVREPPLDRKFECRRHAPVPIVNGRDVQHVWPNTSWGDYCGDFKKDWRLYGIDD